MRQSTLSPIDARLLVNARSHSVDSIRSRLDGSFRLALQGNVEPTTAARLAIESLAALTVHDRRPFEGTARRNVVEGALARHGAYFEELAGWQAAHPDLVESILDELGDGVDYSTIDARSINAVYELFLTPDLRKKFGARRRRRGGRAVAWLWALRRCAVLQRRAGSGAGGPAGVRPAGAPASLVPIMCYNEVTV